VGVERTFGGAGPDERVDLVDEDDDFLVVLELLQQALEALLELSAVLGPGHQERQVERENSAIGEQRRDVAVHDPRREALDDRRLAHSGLAQQERVVLGASAEDLDDSLDLFVPPDERIELALRGQQRQVPRVLADVGRVIRRGLGLELASPLHDLLAEPEQLESVSRQILGGGRILDSQQAQQQVFGPDRRVTHALRLMHRERQRLLGFL
jgi:hypothetical protein